MASAKHCGHGAWVGALVCVGSGRVSITTSSLCSVVSGQGKQQWRWLQGPRALCEVTRLDDFIREGVALAGVLTSRANWPRYHKGPFSTFRGPLA